MKYVVAVKGPNGIHDEYTYDNPETAKNLFVFFNSQPGLTATITVK